MSGDSGRRETGEKILRMNGLKKVLVLGVLGMCLMAGMVESADLYVPGSFTTIQAGVNAANPGDTIYVAAYGVAERN